MWEEIEVREGVTGWSEEVERWEESGAVGVPSDSYKTKTKWVHVKKLTVIMMTCSRIFFFTTT